MTVLIIIHFNKNVAPGSYMYEKTIKLYIQQGFQLSRIGVVQRCHFRCNIHVGTFFQKEQCNLPNFIAFQ